MRVTEAWRPTAPTVTCGTLCRSVEHYRQVVAQFEVESNPRYRARETKTYCNIFLWDVTRAMGAEVPYWWFRNELDANEQFEWLMIQGGKYGWSRASLLQAEQNAFLGCPTLVAWKNPDDRRPGHVAVVLPGASGRATISQAGKTNLHDAPLSAGFGNLAVTFFCHA